MFVDYLNLISALKFSRNELLPGLSQKDSSVVSQKDLDELVEKIIVSNDDHIIVTCGLTKIVDIARYVKIKLRDLNQKQIVFTGSHDFFTDLPGDARFNLGFAKASRFQNANGVYVAINAELHDPDNLYLSMADRTSSPLIGVNTGFDSNLLMLNMGGTIEGQELDINRTLKNGNSESFLRKYINPYNVPHFHKITPESDSRELLNDIDKYSNIIEQIVRNCGNSNIVVTIGTYAAAGFVSEFGRRSNFIDYLGESRKNLVFAGSMSLPDIQFGDADFSLGFTMGGIKYLKPGVYLSMHGVFAEPDVLVKDDVKKEFVLSEAISHELSNFHLSQLSLSN